MSESLPLKYGLTARIYTRAELAAQKRAQARRDATARRRAQQLELEEDS